MYNTLFANLKIEFIFWRVARLFFPPSHFHTLPQKYLAPILPEQPQHLLYTTHLIQSTVFLLEAKENSYFYLVQPRFHLQWLLGNHFLFKKIQQKNHKKNQKQKNKNLSSFPLKTGFWR